VVVESY